MAEPEIVRVSLDSVGDLVLTYHPDLGQFIVGLQRAGDDAPMAQDDFYVSDDEGLANPTTEMLEAEIREGLENRGKSDLAVHAGALARRFVEAYPDRLDD